MTGRLQTRLAESMAQFRDDTRGATAILFAVLAVPVLGLGIAAIDYGRAHTTKSAIEHAADAAARAGANMLGAPHSDIEDTVRGYLNTNLPKDINELPFELSFADEDKALTIKLNTSVRTSILGIVGVNDVKVAVESTVERPDPIKELRKPSLGVTPELPPEVARQLPGLDRHISPTELRDAEVLAKQILSDLERQGASPDVERLLRTLQDLR